MPNYSFKCTQCDTNFMKSMTFGSKELPACPKCRGKTQKIITAPSMIFKGSGFYKTDSNKQAAPASVKKDATPPVQTPAAAPQSPTSQTNTNSLSHGTTA
ncbi:MAG: hypothetical protein KBD00_03720 [Candidatus Peribacteraceae bacterium]|nr:hypothetical protein [Candidatus Peribacteraceae bacterium]